MVKKVVIIYNAPEPSRSSKLGEESAVLGVMDEVKAAARSLKRLGYEVERMPLRPPLYLVKERLSQIKADLVFNIFEGFDGQPETESIVAGYLEELGLRFTGSPASALALALDKAKAREIMRAVGILTPEYQVLTPATLGDFRLTYPVIVKPVAEDASHGINPESVVSDNVALARQVEKVSELFRGCALVEEFLDGREFNVTVMGNQELTVLPISELTYSLPDGLPRVLTFAGKWRPGDPYYWGTRVVCPARVDERLRREISDIAVAAYRCLGCRGYARVDIRLDSEGRPRVLEVNPNPDITPGYGVSRQARAAGMTYTQFVERVVALALEADERIAVHQAGNSG